MKYREWHNIADKKRSVYLLAMQSPDLKELGLIINKTNGWVYFTISLIFWVLEVRIFYQRWL